MKKIILLLPVIFIFVQTTVAQINLKEYTYTRVSGVNENGIGLMIAKRPTNDSFWVPDNDYSLTESLLKDSSFMKNRPKTFNALNTFDSTKVQFFLYGVNRKNANEYEYRVIGNQNEIVEPWSTITKFGPALDFHLNPKSSPYIGGFKTELGHKLIVDVRKKGSNHIIASAAVRWLPISPILLNIYTGNELNDFLKRLKQNGTYPLSVKEINKWKQQYPTDQLDLVTSLPKKLKVAPDDNNLIFLLKANIRNKEQIEYELIRNNKVVRSWNVNDFDNGFIWLRNLKPGEYLLRMRYNVPGKNITEYPFVVEAAWYQTTLFKGGVVFLIISYLGFVVYLFPVLRQKHRAKEELAKKEKLQLELKALYAQLNPHFVFNALSSIQGLINKQDIEGANLYLSDFARLMRDSITNNNKELTTLKEEILTLETYLKLEQLRFGFAFEIKTNDINIYETEIPSLLLQPLIENAVKHGISSLKEKGVINLVFSKNSNDMVVTLADNGGGFKYAEELPGFGLKLTQDRIKLLNQIMNKQTIELVVNGNMPSGTVVCVQFKNWFL